MIRKTIQEIADMIEGTLILNQGNQNTMVEGVCIDSRSIQKNNLYIPIVGERVDGHTFIEKIEGVASLTLCENEAYIPNDLPTILVEDSIVALQQLAKRYRLSLSCKVIGITGSNGKTSCKDILSGIFSANYKTQKTKGNRNNEIGVPLTLLDLDEDCEMAVIEMGMENKHEIHFLNDIVQQDMAIITSVGIAHLENLGTLHNIGLAKVEIADGLHEGNLFIYNGDDEILSSIMKEYPLASGLQVQTFGESKTNTMYLTSITQDAKGIMFTTNQSDTEYKVPILGKHQAYNAMAAILIAKALKMSEEDVCRGLLTIENTSMRNELLTINQCTILNDAYKSNPQSALAALETFDQFSHPYKICVLADMLDLGETTKALHYELGASLQEFRLQEIICMGTLANEIALGAKEHCPDAKVVVYENREQVLSHIKEYIHKDCMILFKGSRGMALDLVIEKMKEYNNNDKKN